MFDWKVIAAVFIALIIVSYVVVGVPGIGEFFGSVAEGIGKALEGSPFGGLFSSPGIRKTAVEITLYPGSISLKPELPVNITAGDTGFHGFRGEISVDFANSTVSMRPEGSPLVISPGLDLIVVEGLKIGRMNLEGIRASVKSGDTTTEVENGTLEILDFLGEGRITRGNVLLLGNVTRVRSGEWEIG